MKVLGIDPGTRNVGFALVEETSSNGGYRCLESGTLSLGEGEVLGRLIKLQHKLRAIVDALKPDCIAFESLIYVKSPTALIKLSMAKGVMLGVIAQDYEGRIFEYKPNMVKQVVTGHGHADKESVQKMIKMLLKKEVFSSHDESDAICIALCHLMLTRGKISVLTKKSKRGSLADALSHRVNEDKL